LEDWKSLSGLYPAFEITTVWALGFGSVDEVPKDVKLQSDVKASII
jgi:hypothetical protein